MFWPPPRSSNGQLRIDDMQSNLFTPIFQLSIINIIHIMPRKVYVQIPMFDLALVMFRWSIYQIFTYRTYLLVVQFSHTKTVLKKQIDTNYSIETH